MRGFLLIAVFAMSLQYAAADEPFNGRVIRPDGRGVKASVRVVGSDGVARADGKGRFGLTNVEADDTLQFVFRRDTLLIPVEGRRSIEVVWHEEGRLFEATESEELMNYGFGYVKRRESVDYSSGISGDRLRATGASTLVDAIRMCYPGLRYINGELCLLTQNSVNSSSAVLVLCDGMEVRPEMINLYDVKSVEIIKGSNMYGFRGVNGVVLITTMTAEDALNRKR